MGVRNVIETEKNYGGIAVILLPPLMTWRFMIIANNAEDLYGSMIVIFGYGTYIPNSTPLQPPLLHMAIPVSCVCV